MIRHIAAATLMALPAAGQDAASPAADGLGAPTLSTQSRGAEIGFTLRAGVAARPEYFGAGTAEPGLDLGVGLNYLRFGGVTVGDPDPLFVPTGFGVGGSLRYVGARDDDESPELAGLEDVDGALEVGVRVRYATRDYRVFGAVRYGVVGHESFVGELGADAFLRPNDRLTLRLGPRAAFGDSDYMDTYFGVSDGEAAASAFDAFDPGSGVVSTGAELGVGYRFNDDWGVDAALRYERLRGDAADSPISRDDEQVSARIGVTRRFTFGF